MLRSLLPILEHAVKGPVWDCQMCGQCVLHETGMTCPMTCPKTLRNGPCGGMPDRHTLYSVFLPMAMGAGLRSAIMDARTPSIVTAVKAGDLMLGNDEWGMAWISAHRAREAAQGT